MGIVYEARDRRLGRTAALKILRPDPRPPGGRRPSPSRGGSGRRLQHPNIVQLYEIGEYRGALFLCLENVGGGNLAARLAAAPLPVRAAAELVETLAGAMAYAHGRGVLHRDLKPANVLLQAAAGELQTDPGASAI